MATQVLNGVGRLIVASLLVGWVVIELLALVGLSVAF